MRTTRTVLCTVRATSGGGKRKQKVRQRGRHLVVEMETKTECKGRDIWWWKEGTKGKEDVTQICTSTLTCKHSHRTFLQKLHFCSKICQQGPCSMCSLGPVVNTWTQESMRNFSFVCAYGKLPEKCVCFVDARKRRRSIVPCPRQRESMEFRGPCQRERRRHR